jgi:four helix bundle protein
LDLKEQIKDRTKKIGLDVIKMVGDMPAGNIALRAVSAQIVRCATSIGANYRAACRAKSDADFLNKLKIVEEETDETLYWLEILEDGNFVGSKILDELKKETNEILSIIVASIRTVKNRINPKS